MNCFGCHAQSQCTSLLEERKMKRGQEAFYATQIFLAISSAAHWCKHTLATVVWESRENYSQHTHTHTYTRTHTHALTGACCRSGLFLPRACWEHLETPEWQHVRTALDKEVNCALRGQCVDMQLIVLNCARGRNPRCPSTLSWKSMVRGTWWPSNAQMRKCTTWKLCVIDKLRLWLTQLTQLTPPSGCSSTCSHFVLADGYHFRRALDHHREAHGWYDLRAVESTRSTRQRRSSMRVAKCSKGEVWTHIWSSFAQRTWSSGSKLLRDAQLTTIPTILTDLKTACEL